MPMTKMIEIVDEFLDNFKQYACIINCRKLPCLCKNKDPIKEDICYKCMDHPKTKHQFFKINNFF